MEQEGSWAGLASVSGLNMASGEKVEGAVLAAVGRLELIPQAELPLVLQLQPHDGLTQRVTVPADHTQCGTFEEVKLLEEARDNEGVTQVEQQAAEDQTLVVQVSGVWPGADVAH